MASDIGRRLTKATIEDPQIDAKAVAGRINRLRRRETRGWTVARLAKVAGIPAATMSSYCSAHRIPSVYNVCRIAIALGCTTDFLLLGRGDREVT